MADKLVSRSASEVGAPILMKDQGDGSFAEVMSMAASVGILRHDIRSLATSNPTLVKAGAGRFYGFILQNTGAAGRWMKFYDKATAPTVGTDSPFWMGNVGAGAVGPQVPFLGFHGVPFTLGLGYGITVSQAESDATAVGANEVTGFLLYS